MRILLLVFFAGSALAQSPAPGISEKGRWHWAVSSTVGPPNLAGGVVSSAWSTLFNRPKEYGPHWEGFGKRYAMRLTGSATSNGMEAALSGIWGEDPRYPRAAGKSFGGRIANVIKMAFLARDDAGNIVPAYARYAAIPASNYLSNAWRPDSQATAKGAAIRTGLGFLARMAGNAFAEFWPDVRRTVHGRNP
jgi:hypothetical protein